VTKRTHKTYALPANRNLKNKEREKKKTEFKKKKTKMGQK